MSDNAGSIYSEVEIRLDKVQQDLNVLVNQFQKFGKQVDTITDQAGKNVKDNVTKPLIDVKLAAAAASAAIIVAFKSILSTFADTDQALANVQAATRATASDMALLEGAASSAGKMVGASMAEALGAVEALAKAGVSTSDIIGGALTGALTLAAAGSMDVADAAEIASATMTQFGLAGKDVTHIADLLAAGAGKAQGEVSDLSQALKQSGLIAAQTGLSIEDTIGALSAFASAGLLGSDAGTSFRTMLLRLTPQSKEAADEMKRLGITAFDSKGNFIGLSTFAQKLQDNLKGLTTEQRNSALATVFGSDSIRAANILYTQGAKGIEEWKNKVNDSGFAADTARIKLDNFNGDLQKLGAESSSTASKIGTGLDPTLRALTQALTGAIGFIGSLGSGFLSFAATATVVTAGIFGISGALGALGISVSAVFGPIGLLVSGLAALTAGAIAAGAAMDNENIKQGLATFGEIGQKAGFAGKELQQFGRESKKIEDNLASLTGAQAKMFNAERFKTMAENAGLTNDQLAQIVLSSGKVNESIKNVARTFVDAKRASDEFTKKQIEDGKAMEEYWAKRYPNALKTATKEQAVQAEEGTKITQGELDAQIFVYQNAQNRIAEIIDERRNATQAAAKQEEDDIASSNETIIGAYAYAQNRVRDIVEARIHETQSEEEKANQQRIDDLKKWADTAMSIFQALAQSLSSLFTSNYQSQIDELTARYDKERELIENNGKTKEQALKDELQTAIASGDAQAVSDAEKKLKLYQLDQDYAKKKAKLEYDSAVASWEIQVALATAQAAQAVLNAFTSSASAGIAGLIGAPAAAGVAAALGALQIAAVVSAKPKAPQFATGGIVLPSGQSGKQVTVADQGGGEIMFGTGALGDPLMQGFADLVASRVSGQNGGGNATVQVVLDGRVIAESTAKLIDNGIVKMRSLTK